MRFKIFLITMTALYLTFMFQIGAFAADLNKVYVESGYSKNRVNTELGNFKSNGYDVSLGLEVLNNLDIKLGYHNFGKETNSYSQIIQGINEPVLLSGQSTVDLRTISFGVKPKLNVGEYINVYVEGGYHKYLAKASVNVNGVDVAGNKYIANASAKEYGSDIYYGVGVELEVGALRIGIANKTYNSEDENLDSLQGFIGFSKKF